MQVLVVEDEALIRMLVCDLLEEAGFNCAGAADAAEALALLDLGYRPDILVTDFNLGPGPDGKMLAREVARRLPGLPTVFVTGNPECFADHLMEAWERLIAKPFAGAELVAAIDEFRTVERPPAPTASGPGATGQLLALLHKRVHLDGAPAALRAGILLPQPG